MIFSRFAYSQPLVRKGGSDWVCRLDAKGWKCGRCLRGLVAPKTGSVCRVCRAKVRMMVVVRAADSGREGGS